MPAIPASAIVNVNPGVVAAGGSALALSGLMLTQSARIPIGQVQSFATPAAVASYFGGGSQEKANADKYFAGYANSRVKPGAMLFAQYNPAAVPAFLRSGSLASMTLAQLNAIAAGTLTITINGQTKTSTSIDLSAAGSFSAAAATIQTALALNDASFTGAITATTLTVTGTPTGVLAVGQTVQGVGVTAGTIITALGSGTGGAGTYTVNNSQSVASASLTSGPAVVSYDSVLAAFTIQGGTPGATGSISYGSGAIATALKFTQTLGAVVSAGAAAAVPGSFMDAVAASTQNWASFSTIWEPSTDDGLAFAAWNSAQNHRWAYVAWDTELAATTQGNTTNLGYQIQQAADDGVILIWEPSDQLNAAQVMGFIASIDFTSPNARVTMAFRQQAGMAAGVTDQQIAANLESYGYNYIGAFATANDQFIFMYPGSISGPFLWIDSYVNQIWMNNQFQLDLMELLTTAGSIPYNADGNAQIEASLADTINQALVFGAIRTGVVLSEEQTAEINGTVGFDIATTISQRGWYLYIGAATPQVRQARGSPPMIFWYTDGQSVQKITLSSLEVQ